MEKSVTSYALRDKIDEVFESIEEKELPSIFDDWFDDGKSCSQFFSEKGFSTTLVSRKFSDHPGDSASVLYEIKDKNTEEIEYLIFTRYYEPIIGENFIIWGFGSSPKQTL